VKNARLAQVNRLRAKLELAPLTAQQIAHDRSLAEPKGLRLAGLTKRAVAVGDDRPDRLGPLHHEPVVDRFDRALGEGRR
jgi:hypothetical protein